LAPFRFLCENVQIFPTFGETGSFFLQNKSMILKVFILRRGAAWALPKSTIWYIQPYAVPNFLQLACSTYRLQSYKLSGASAGQVRTQNAYLTSNRSSFFTFK